MKYMALMLALALSMGLSGVSYAGGCGGGKEKDGCGKCTHEKGSDECKKECADKKAGGGC